MPTPETFGINTGGSALSPLPLHTVTTPPRPSTAGPNSIRRHTPAGGNRRSGSSSSSTSSHKRNRRRRPSTAVAKSASKARSQWPKKQQFRSWRQNSQQLSSLRPKPSPPRSFQDELLARQTWRDIDVSQLELSPLRSISSQTILLQDQIQTCIAQLGSAPYGKSKDIFTELASHTKICFKQMEQNLAIVAEETHSVNVAQQAMHALSHSTLLQRVWKDAEYYVSSLSQRAAAAEEQHTRNTMELEKKYQSRIIELEQQVQELTPKPMSLDFDDEDENNDATPSSTGASTKEQKKNNKNKQNKNKMSLEEEHLPKQQGIVGRYTLNARDRNKRRTYSNTDATLKKLNQDLMKWHDAQDVQNEMVYTRLEIRQQESARLRENKHNHHNDNNDKETVLVMTPAERHQVLEKFMYMISKVDDHGRALMLEELFMSFKGVHRVEAIAGMLLQVSSSNRYLLMTDLHNEMKTEQKRRFLKMTLNECDDKLAQMLFESLCEKIPVNRRRDLLHEQVDTLGTAQMMKIIQELITESIGESSRLQLVDGLTSFLSPAEKRECIVNIIFGVTIENVGHGYSMNDVLFLIQEGSGDDQLKIRVTGIGDGGKITAVSLISTGKGYEAGVATCQDGNREAGGEGGYSGGGGGGGSGASFMLEPSSRQTRTSLLTRLAVVLPKIRSMIESGSPPGSPKSTVR